MTTLLLGSVLRAELATAGVVVLAILACSVSWLRLAGRERFGWLHPDAPDPDPDDDQDGAP